ncbi:SID1 transmembrane family member 1 [Armadillidium nasatum]|uniref:SID1 transmembrane family member 1 n=1 Tax=Armadillidium nasatum TaxID=96803 RepID=A0A5N5SJV9_9CRUS|nr:SID1 transmembrane family member 1 [Armadillidium nasatum]
MFVNENNCTAMGSPSISVKSNNPCLFHCTYDPSKINVGLVRFSARIYSNSANATVSISARQDRGITSWNLPQTFAEHGSSQLFQTIEEVLCPFREIKNDTIYFRIETSSLEDVVLNVSLNRTPYAMQFMKPVRITTSPVSPWFKFYDWNEQKGETVLVTAKNFGKGGNSICAYLAIQNAQCPVATTKASITAGNTRYLSFQRQGGMIARKSDFPNGIFIIVLSMPSDEPCTGIPEGSQNITKRKKTVELEILPHTTVSENWSSFFFTGFIISAIIIGHNLLIKKIYRVPSYERLGSSEEGTEEETISRRILGIVIRQPSRDDVRQRSLSTSLHEEEEEENRQHQQAQLEQAQLELNEEGEQQREGEMQQRHPLILSSGNPSDNQFESEPPTRSLFPECDNPVNERQEGNGRTLALGNVQNNSSSSHFLPLALVQVNSSSNPMYMSWWMKKTEFVRSNSVNNAFDVGFYINLLIIAGFMTLAVLRILKNLLHIYNKGGEDQCYFNTLCMSSFWFFPNFSPIFTNLPYIFCGCSLLHIYHLHEKFHLSKDTKYGVFNCYDVFRSLAVGLILVGIMSSFYHICPNKITFSFDIMFIYVEAIILIVAVWGLRHGTVITHVYSTIGFFAVILLTAELKDFISYQIFWTLVILFHFVVMTAIATMLCKFGTWNFSPVSIYQLFRDWNTMAENFQTLLREEGEQNLHNKIHFTVIRTLIGLLANFALMIIGPMVDLNMYFYVLLACVGNMVLYLLNYIVTKTYCNNCIIIEYNLYIIY